MPFDPIRAKEYKAGLGIISDEPPVATFARALVDEQTVPQAQPVAATQAQAEAGVNNTAMMTPLRTSEAIAALATSGGDMFMATYDVAEKEAQVLCTIDFANQAEAEAGSNNTKVMTPLRAAQSIDLRGLRVMPRTWKSVWSNAPHYTYGDVVFTTPTMEFPTGLFVCTTEDSIAQDPIFYAIPDGPWQPLAGIQGYVDMVAGAEVIRADAAYDESGAAADAQAASQPLSAKLTAIAAATPVADGTYTVGIGATTNGTITVEGGIITAVQEAV